MYKIAKSIKTSKTQNVKNEKPINPTPKPRQQHAT